MSAATTSTDARARLFGEARLGPATLRNRIVKAATFETMSPEGTVSDELIAWHRAIAAGGVGMTTLAYCAVESQGLTFRDQITMSPAMVAPLKRFTDAMHSEGAAAQVQLGHAGWFADPRAAGTRPEGPSAVLSPKAMTRSKEMTPEDLARCRDAHADAAEIAVAAGFDSVEVHVGHGYLLSQFLGPYTNRRKDSYGGSIENRARFPREVARAVHDRVNGRAAVTIKLNMDDGFRGGMTAEEGVAVAKMFASDGSVDAIQLTGGHTTKSPMFLMRGVTPRTELAGMEKTAIRKAGMRAALQVYLRDHPFSEAFFRPHADAVRAAVDTPLMLLGGITRLASMTGAMDAGFDFVALGRALVHDADFVRKLEAGEISHSACVPCNQCVAFVGQRPTACTRVTA